MKLRNKNGTWGSSLLPQDKLLFQQWIKEQKDINWCIRDILTRYPTISPMTAYRWMEEAAKVVGESNK